MKERMTALIKTLENKYASPDAGVDVMLSSSGTRKYGLHPLEGANFNKYSPYDSEKQFKVAAADAGSLLIYETPTWSLGYYKISYRLFEVSLEGKTCNTVQTKKERKEDFVLVLNGEGPNSDNVVHKRPGKDAESALNEFRAQREVEFVEAQLQSLDKEDLLLVDGTLENENSQILKNHANTIGLSKKTGLSIGGCSAPSFFSMLATENNMNESPWFYHPLVKTSPVNLEHCPDIIFGTLRQNSVVLRFDFPKGSSQEFIDSRMKQLGICSLDAKYRSYPYPLGAVHSDSVMRKNTKELVKRFIRTELNKYSVTGKKEICELIEKDILHADWYDNLRKYS